MYNVPYFLISAHVYATLFFLLVTAISQTARNQKEKLLNVSNSFILIILFLETLNIGLLFFTSNEGNSSIGIDYYEVTKACIVIIIFLFHLLFLKKRFREKVSFTVISVLLLYAVIDRDRVALSVASYIDNYLSLSWSFRPSSWSVFYVNPFKVPVAVISLCYLLICWFVAKMKFKL